MVLSDMWPWDSNQMWTHKELQFMIPQFPYQVSPRNVLDYRFGLVLNRDLSLSEKISQLGLLATVTRQVPRSR